MKWIAVLTFAISTLIASASAQGEESMLNPIWSGARAIELSCANLTLADYGEELCSEIAAELGSRSTLPVNRTENPPSPPAPGTPVRLGLVWVALDAAPATTDNVLVTMTWGRSAGLKGLDAEQKTELQALSESLKDPDKRQQIVDSLVSALLPKRR